jgi:hypothetical protein
MLTAKQQEEAENSTQIQSINNFTLTATGVDLFLNNFQLTQQ